VPDTVSEVDGDALVVSEGDADGVVETVSDGDGDADTDIVPVTVVVAVELRVAAASVGRPLDDALTESEAVGEGDSVALTVPDCDGETVVVSDGEAEEEDESVALTVFDCVCDVKAESVALTVSDAVGSAEAVPETVSDGDGEGDAVVVAGGERDAAPDADAVALGDGEAAAGEDGATHASAVAFHAVPGRHSAGACAAPTGEQAGAPPLPPPPPPERANPAAQLAKTAVTFGAPQLGAPPARTAPSGHSANGRREADDWLAACSARGGAARGGDADRSCWGEASAELGAAAAATAASASTSASVSAGAGARRARAESGMIWSAWLAHERSSVRPLPIRVLTAGPQTSDFKRFVYRFGRPTRKTTPVSDKKRSAAISVPSAF